MNERQRFSKAAVIAYAERRAINSNAEFFRITGRYIDVGDGHSQVDPKRWTATARHAANDDSIKLASIAYATHRAMRDIIVAITSGEVVQ